MPRPVNPEASIYQSVTGLEPRSLRFSACVHGPHRPRFCEERAIRMRRHLSHVSVLRGLIEPTFSTGTTKTYNAASRRPRRRVQARRSSYRGKSRSRCTSFRASGKSSGALWTRRAQAGCRSHQPSTPPASGGRTASENTRPLRVRSRRSAAPGCRPESGRTASASTCHPPFSDAALLRARKSCTSPRS